MLTWAKRVIDWTAKCRLYRTQTSLKASKSNLYPFVGPLTLMPLFMGMGVGAAWNLSAVTQAMPSLIGHLIFGGILGWTYAWLGHGATGRPAHRRHADAV